MRFVKDYVRQRLSMSKNIFIIFAFFISACSLSDGKDIEYVKDPLNPNRMVTVEDAERTGKLKISDFTGNDKKDNFQVNKYLWNACLDILEDFPTNSLKSDIGLYETEYVQSGDKYIKIRCRVKGSEILSKNLDVIIFEKKSSDAVVKTFEDKSIKSQILLRARELKAEDV